MDDQQTYRRIKDGALEQFSVEPGDGWERYDGPAQPRRSGLPLPAPAVHPGQGAPSQARFEYALERIGTSFTTRGFEQQLGELIGRYSAEGWRVCTSLASGERTSHLLFERAIG